MNKFQEMYRAKLKTAEEVAMYVNPVISVPVLQAWRSPKPSVRLSAKEQDAVKSQEYSTMRFCP